ncbi:MAG: flagellar basal body L-ring protein FlgH, partial [Phycisphaerales bacterium]|nr:flagellar basal body L-ring protein FlgH [Phycisphaerales bacterium]
LIDGVRKNSCLNLAVSCDDREITTMVLSGTARQEDITKNNTLQSGQLAGLNIKIEHSGDVKDTAEKGLIPRVLETIFNF